MISQVSRGLVVKVRILAIATVAALLAGCATTDKAGAAAIVGGTKIPSSLVSTQVNEARIDIENTPPEYLQDLPTMTLLSQMVIDRLVLEEILKFAITDLKIEVTDAQLGEYRDFVFRNYGEPEVKAQLATRNGVAEKYVDGYIYAIMVQREIMDELAPGMPEQVQSAALYKYLSGIADELKVEVSPRYGTWNSEVMQTVLGENFLSTSNELQQVQ